MIPGTKAIVAEVAELSPIPLVLVTVGRFGYKYAVKNGYQYLVQMDGDDGQHDPAYPDDLIERFETERPISLLAPAFLFRYPRAIISRYIGHRWPER